MRMVSRREDINVNLLRKRIAKGLVVIPANIRHKNLSPIGIGLGLEVKIILA